MAFVLDKVVLVCAFSEYYMFFSFAGTPLLLPACLLICHWRHTASLHDRSQFSLIFEKNNGKHTRRSRYVHKTFEGKFRRRIVLEGPEGK